MFYDNFKRLCEERGEKPTPVAQKLGCSSSNVALWKKGSVPRPPVLEKMAAYFDVAQQELLFGDEKTPPVGADGVNEKDRIILELSKQLSEDQKDLLIAQLKILGAQK